MLKIKNNRILAILMLLIIFQQGFSQEKKYLDENWKETTQEKAHFYRLIKKENDSLFFIKDYYINGNLQMDGYFSNLEKETLHHTINWYNESGQKTITKNYKYGTQVGEEITYLSNNITIIGVYKDDEPYEGVFYDACTYCSEYLKYEKGKQISKIKYYRNSNQIAIEEFIDEDRNTIRIDYYGKDNNKNTLHYVEYSQKNAGTELDYYKVEGEITTVKTKKTYVDGKLNGEEISYDRKENIWLKGTYVLGDKYDGYFIDGLAKEQFKKGIQIGERVQYDADFNNIGNVTYQNGKPYQGVLYNYAYEIHYSKGKKTKKIVHFDDDRTKVRNSIEYLDQKNSKVDWYNEQGELLGTGFYIDDKIENGFNPSWKYTHELYKNGMKNGIEKEFDPSRSDSEMSVKTLTNYKDDSVIWQKTLKPNSKDFYHCDFNEGKPYNGIIGEDIIESMYKDGRITKKSYYDRDWKTGELTLETEIFYNDANEVIKETKFKKGIAYTLEYNKDYPYNGRKYNYNSFVTYKNGKIEGDYANFVDDKIIEKGKLIDGKREGMVFFTPIDGPIGLCLFKNDKPDTGNVSTKEEIVFYSSGKKQGDCKTFFYANFYHNALGDPSVKKDEISTTYKKGIKTKEIAIINGLEKLTGTFKDGKMYNGTFYIREENKVESYKNGKKHGITKAIDASLLKMVISYESGTKKWVEVTNTDNNQILAKGTYKNNSPYKGTFLKDIENKGYIITTYKKGKRHGEELFIEALDLLNLSKNKGTYKKDKPYSGSFVVFKEGIKITSEYKKGEKHLYEKYETRNRTIDSLYYENGSVRKGIKFERIDNAFFKHHYSNGTLDKIKATSRDEFGSSIATIVFPKENEIQFSFKKRKGIAYNTVRVAFINKKRTAGEITYIDDENDFIHGSFKFLDGHLTSGKVDALTKYKMSYSVRIDKEKHIALRFKEFDTRYYTEIILKNNIPKKLTYHDATLLIKVFTMRKKEFQKAIKIKQYLNDGTLLAEGFIGDEIDKGTMIEHRRKLDGTMSYTITTYPENAKSKKDKIVIKDLNFEEMVKKVKELKK